MRAKHFRADLFYRLDVLEIRMPSSYVYLGGQIALDATVGEGGAIQILFSDTNGLHWKDVASLAASGPRTIDLQKFVLRRYDYRLRFVLKGRGTGLERLNLSNQLQCSQRALPALTQGDNTCLATTSENVLRQRKGPRNQTR